MRRADGDPQIPFTCLQFPLYERLKLVAARKRTRTGKVADLPASEAALCGSIAGGVAAGLTTPLDVAKTRIMLSSRSATNGGAKYYPSSLSKTLGIIFAEEGPRALFAGVVPRVAWISLGGAVFLGVYERVKQVASR